MKKIPKTKIINAYINDEVIINKYLYFHDEDKDFDKYYIMRVQDIEVLQHNKIEYHADQCKIFTVPKNYNGKCYVYDMIKNVIIDYKNTELFEMSVDEYINTYRFFVENYGRYKNDISDKIIQDI